MNNSDLNKFSNAFVVLCEIFDKRVSETLTKVYFKALQKFSISEVEKAISSAITSCKFMPKPVELIELMGGGIEDVARVQATKVFEAVARVGGYESVCFDDPITMAVIEKGYGGWNRLCNEALDDNRKWDLIEFEKLYKSYHAQDIKKYGHLPGRHEISNNAHGHLDMPKPRLIGDQKKAVEVLTHDNKKLLN